MGYSKCSTKRDKYLYYKVEIFHLNNLTVYLKDQGKQNPKLEEERNNKDQIRNRQIVKKKKKGLMKQGLGAVAHASNLQLRGDKVKSCLKRKKNKLGAVAHAYNPST